MAQACGHIWMKMLGRDQGARKNIKARHGGPSNVMLVSIETSAVLAGLSPTDFFGLLFLSRLRQHISLYGVQIVCRRLGQPIAKSSSTYSHSSIAIYYSEHSIVLINRLRDRSGYFTINLP